MTRSARLILSLLCVLAACGAARAVASSDAPASDPDLSTQDLRRAGPLYLRAFGLLKDVGYDDNVRFDSPERQGDATATTGAGLDTLLLTGDRGGLRLYQELDYVAFQRNVDLNHWNGEARARGILLLHRLQLSLEDHFRSERERPDNDVDLRLRRSNNAVGLAARTLFPGRLSLKGSLHREGIDYTSDDPASDVAADRLDRSEDTLALGAEARILPKTTFVLDGSATSVAFDDPTQKRDADMRTVQAGVRLDPAALLQGDFEAGPLVLRARERDDSDFHGLVGSGHLSRRLGGSARLKTAFDRSVGFSILADNLYYVSTNGWAAYEQYFTRHLSGEASCGRTLNHYPDETTRTGPQPFQGRRDDRVTTYRLAVRYRSGAQITFTAGASRQIRDSTDDFYDRDRMLYTFGTSYEF